MSPEQQRLTDILARDLVAWPGRSEIDGVGLFALRPIANGESILYEPFTYRGAIPFDGNDLMKVPPHVREWLVKYCGADDIPLVWLNKSLEHGMFHLGCLCLCFLNSSSNPNLVWREDESGRWFEALRDIRKGEELTIQYDLHTCTLEYFTDGVNKL